MPNIFQDDFSKLEHEGWSRVADLYDQSWAVLTKQFSKSLMETADIRSGMKVLDLACGPGYISQDIYKKRANVIGVDFSAAMIGLAKQAYPHIEFLESDVQQLDFTDETFDCVVMNFGMLHLARPLTAIKEAARVLKEGGKYVFTVWAGPDKSPAAKVMFESIQQFADQDVNMPAAPDSYFFSDEKLCRQALTENGFNESTFQFKYQFAEWVVPNAEFLFETELKAGVRTAALLKRQSSGALEKIRRNVITGMQQFFDGKQYRLTFCGCIISAAKEKRM
jgi:ubiquinone/menaquinone biosynthesis C-methylase UbiE